MRGQLPDILEVFARLEPDGPARRNANFLTGPRIAADAALSRFHLEHAKSTQFNAIAALPLAPGYTLGFRNFDVQKQKPQMKLLKVVGAESITVPGGTFDTYKVEISSADNEDNKTTVWISKDSRKVVKISAVLTALNGAILTSELLD